MTVGRFLQYVGAASILAALGMAIKRLDVAVPVLGDYRLVLTAAGVTALLGVGYVVAAGGGDADWWRPVDTEPGYRVPVPGDGLADEPEQAIRERVRHHAIETLVDAGADSHDDARRAVETGRWTSDRLARAYLGEPAIPTRARLLAWLRGDVPAEVARKRAIEAIRSIQEGDGDGR